MKKKYLITGANGFVGTSLVINLINSNQEVHIISRNKNINWRLMNFEKSIHVHDVDLTDKVQIEKLFSKNSFDIVFHLATYGGHSFQKDIDTIIDTNLIGTWNLVKICHQSGVEMFVNTSSSSEYGEKFESMKEDMVLNPNNMYGATKASSTILCSTYSKLNNFPLCTLRLFSPYGYYDSPSRLIPTVISNCLKNKDIYLCDKNSKRDFIFIEDVIDAYLNISTSNIQCGEIYNVGSGIEYTVEDIVKKIVSLTNSNSNLYWNNDFDRQYEPQHWFSDISKIKYDLSWSPKTNIDTGLEKTIEWFRANINLYS